LRTLAFAAALASFATLAAAGDPPVLTVYTYDSFVSEYGPGPVIEERFEADCACDLRLVAAGDGAQLLGRLRLEGARTEADVVLGLDTNLTAAAAATGLFAPHGIAPPPLSLPVAWEDPLFLPFDWGWFAFVYDATRLPDPPRSFAALLDAPDDVTLVIQDPRTSTPGLGLLLWVKDVYGARAGEVWARLAPRIVTVTDGWWEAYSAFLEGEAAMVLSYQTSPAYHVHAEQDATKRAAIFDEGHYLQIEVAGRLAASDRPDLADRFLRFMLSEDFQSVIPTTNWMYPAATPAGGLPAAFADLPVPAVSRLIPPAEVPAIRAEALDQWLEALTR
jgi:thiamine transport system substrate-binding protein